MSAIAFYTWLQSERNYQQGLYLYLAAGTNSFLKKILSQGDSSYNREKLAAEIEAIAEKGTAKATPAGTTAVEKAVSESLYPEAVVAIINERNRLFKESSYLQSRLRYLKNAEERRSSAALILNNFDTIDDLWDKLAYFKLHNSLPPELSVQGQRKYETDPVRMANRLRTLRTYISRDHKNAQKATKVALWRRELAYYEKELGT